MQSPLEARLQHEVRSLYCSPSGGLIATKGKEGGREGERERESVCVCVSKEANSRTETFYFLAVTNFNIPRSVVRPNSICGCGQRCECQHNECNQHHQQLLSAHLPSFLLSSVFGCLCILAVSFLGSLLAHAGFKLAASLQCVTRLSS